MRNKNHRPRGELSLRIVAMQADSDPAGNVHREWTLYLMDQAAVVAARARAKGRVVTAVVSDLSFLQKVKVGDVVCVYTRIMKVGRTSITVEVEGYALRQDLEEWVRVTAAEFVVVAVDEEGLPRALPVAA
jgi:acyl-CoA thioesterase YciA